MKDVSLLSFFRGQGVGYAVLSVEGSIAYRSACGSTKAGLTIPVSLFKADCVQPYTGTPSRDARGFLVAVMPLLSIPYTVSIQSSDGSEPIDAYRYHPLLSKVHSRLSTFRFPALAHSVRGMEWRSCAALPRASVTEIWPGGQHQSVWRCSARFPEGYEHARLSAVFRDTSMTELSHDPIILEDHVVPAEYEPALFERLITVSFRIPEQVQGACIEFELEGDPASHCFTAVSPGMSQGMLGRSRDLATGAAASRDYQRWFDAHRATGALLAWQRQNLPFAGERLISIVVPVFRTPPQFLKECIESVLAQSYPQWELVLVNASPDDRGVAEVLERYADSRIVSLDVENRSIAENTNRGIAAAHGDYVAFLDHDDLLEPDALWRYASELEKHPNTDLLYCDEDRLRDGLYVNPAFKSEPDLSLLRSYNYVTHLLMVSRRVLDATERTPAEMSGAQDYELTLRAFESARRVSHIPRVLYHWREHDGSTAAGSDQKPYGHKAGRLALEAHLARTEGGLVEDGPLSCTYRVRLPLPESYPLVSIIIPSRDHIALLHACVDSIVGRTTYPNYEIVIVENNSTDSKTFAGYRSLAQHEKVAIITWTPDSLEADAPCENGFNYSSIINAGVRASHGEMLLFLNNDTEVIAPDWLEAMVSCFAREDVGVVGAKLLFEDGLVQHAGMVVNGRGDFAHMNRNLSANELGYAYFAGFPREYSMVTGACQMTRRSLFEELGGYDERLAVGFNDGDYCLSVRERGYVVMYQPDALLHHREFSSRGREATDRRLQARLLQEKSTIIAKHPAFFAEGDPAVNPNLDRMSDWWALPESL